MNAKKILPFALFPVAAVAAQNMPHVDERPNIILFMVDDMGWQDTSLPFWTERTPLNERYHTPNMERMAQQGMVFSQAYASAVSSPTRVSLLTGMNAARHRVTNWTLQKNTSTDLEKYWGTETFATEALTLEAMNALDKAKKLDQPFFLHMAHYAIHIPIDRDQRFYQQYLDGGLSEKEAAYAARYGAGSTPHHQTTGRRHQFPSSA